ncbi:type II toxin-antitoxin system Phd/YefM family antitoxin [Inquilinus sp. CAU 1745]|uniref:type II toxin-antitoxin system Phd/YefM family antitoxin n=1 Tax=Inquilinus sp. CAU 1745 TaxID=3140369 RepID=UPI00325C2356
MKSFQVREAKAKFSALIDAAERGQPTTITRHGRAAAVVVPVDDARRLYHDDGPSFAATLLAFPGFGLDLDFERDQNPLKEVDL